MALDNYTVCCMHQGSRWQCHY